MAASAKGGAIAEPELVDSEAVGAAIPGNVVCVGTETSAWLMAIFSVAQVPSATFGVPARGTVPSSFGYTLAASPGFLHG